MKDLSTYSSKFETNICKILKILIANNIEWVSVVVGLILLLCKCLFGLNFSYLEIAGIMLTGVSIVLAFIALYSICFGIDVYRWFKDNNEYLESMSHNNRTELIKDETSKKLNTFIYELYDEVY